MVNPKKKGNRGENNFFKWLRNHNGDKSAMRNPSSGAGYYKSDVINSIGYNFEVKTVKKLGLQQAWKQSERDAEKSQAIPSVVIHFDGMPEDMWLIVIDNYTWADMFKKAQEPKSKEPDRQMRYDLQALKNAATRVMKYLK